MAAVTAALVKQLREVSGAGMMDCKKALTETNGDIDAAVEYLRKNGAMKAAKKANRIAAEGLAWIAQDGDHKAAVVQVNSETDFVAQNEKFRTYVDKVAKQALHSDAKDMDAFLAEKWEDQPDETVNDALIEMIAVISEKLSIRRFEKVEEENGLVATYVDGGGRIGVIVDAETSVIYEVAALSPKYIAASDVPDDVRAHESEILLDAIKKENDELPENKRKPQQILEKQLIGRLNKELREICLNDQVYVKAEDGKQTVSSYLAQVGKANNTTITIKKFVRFEVGEGMEKRNENFAEEVMSQIKK